MCERVSPFYQVVDGVRIPGFFAAEVFRTGLKYKPSFEDFFISGHPKSGTTWVQQIVSIIYNEGKPPRSITDLYTCSPFLDMTGAEGVAKMKRPGSIKTHLPYDKVPYSPETKYLHVVRNPKDVVVSFYHHTNCDVYQFANGNFSEYFDLFVDGKTDFGDYFDYVLSWYEHRNDPNVLYVSYEQLKRDTTKTVKEIAKFMGQKYGNLLEDEEVLENVLKYSNLNFMKSVLNNSFQTVDSSDTEMLEGVRHYAKFQSETKSSGDKPFELIRKGVVGNWRSLFTEDQNRRMNTRTEEKLGKTELYSYWKSIGCV